MAKLPVKSLKERKTETVRERTVQKTNNRPRRIRRAATAGKRPLVKFWSVIVRALRPLRFLLRPFKTRPARFVGRILAKVFFVKYFKEAWGELREVTWPDRRETRQLFFAVIAFAIVFGALVSTVDYGLDKIFRKILLQ